MAIPIKIKSINLVAQYNFNCMNTTCLCNNNLKDFEVKDDVHLGNCGHGFHKTCIVQRQIIDNNCPLCNTPWNFNKNLTDNTIYLYNR
jgi:hypothetical protein